MVMHPLHIYQVNGNTPHVALSSASELMTLALNITTKDDGIHLITTLHQFYKVSIDWSGAHNCGLNIKWHYHRQ